MGGWSEQRLEPRVDYRARVLVMRAGQSQHVVGQSLNLSPRGMLVDAPQPYPVGTEITCDVLLPGGNKALQGRVVRVQPLSPSSTGLGIDFVDLSPADESVLRSLVQGQPDDPDELAVRVNGSTWLFRARAEMNTDGYHLIVPLPFLRADSPIELAASPSAQVITHALVRGIRLQPMGADGVPRLRIAIRLAGGGTADADADATPGPLALDEFNGQPRTPPPQILVADDVRPERTEVTGQRRTAAAAAAKRRSRRLLILLAALLIGATAGLLVRYAPALRTHHWTTAAAASTTTPTVAAAPMPPPRVALLAPKAVAPAPATAPEIVPVPAEPAADKPQFRHTPDGAQATIAVRGSLANERHYALTTPPGFVVNLPGARPVPPMGRYRSSSRAFREIWVFPLRGGGTHLRFLFRGPGKTEPSVELTPGLVTVALPWR